jgi:hypothetical protein
MKGRKITIEQDIYKIKNIITFQTSLFLIVSLLLQLFQT